MKILKIGGIGLLALIAIPLITALFISNDFSYESSVNINAPINEVWENVNSLSDLDKWSPWNELDPDMKKEMNGTDGTVGASSSWISEVKDVGAGTQTISKIEAPNFIETELKFTKPSESEGISYIKLAEDGSSTIATWGLKSQIPYPFNFMNLWTDPEKYVGEPFAKGLGKLKQMSEG